MTKGAISEAGNATVAFSNQTIVDFSFTSSSLPTYLVELLAVPLLLGLILNVVDLGGGPAKRKIQDSLRDYVISLN